MRMSIMLRMLGLAKLRSLVPRIRAFSLFLCLRLEDITLGWRLRIATKMRKPPDVFCFLRVLKPPATLKRK
jgi:hypothetical protein